ncbi:uncharacterized protein PHACADRAFT_154053 [Phanerochaete carnosa HHB-10118-sp]|uniref:Cytochrome P450 n=1 Tax=Phanerochaete carnosa (strain HHB-10118-sp) TaxID=650164 RepID=K5UJ40_PHACS|nr:uncharacterized protein PHACADRAFT_154053 [Phanerochaete carnosa HHB-10118-sp]EKM49581.1 hypothetical protein PHACADRAFT_154053 [Phanerochaete carnosa HHB-10118-sp]
MSLQLWAVCAVILLVLALYRLRRWRPTAIYPPGPPSKPVIGNILDVSPKAAWIKFTKYKDIYGEFNGLLWLSVADYLAGDLVFFHGLGNNLLVLNSLKVAQDLLETRTDIYSDRPTFTVAGELMGLGKSMPLLNYNQEWRAQRKLAHHALGPRAVKQYYVVQEDLAALFSKQILEDPEGFFSHVRLTTARLILSITYGLSVEQAEDEYITHAEDTMHVIGNATLPGAFICDLIPILKHLPSWVPFQKEAKVGREMIERLAARPFEHVKTEMRAGTAPVSLTRDLLSSEIQGIKDKEHSIKWSVSSLYGAGGETTYATVLTCIMLMAMHPDKLKKAQDEIDHAIGIDRLPLISDRENLPYVEALIKEVMRWHPAVPLTRPGVPHCTAKDDIYEGYTIPKGTIVIPNLWAIAMERTDQYDPSTFVPERFLDKNNDRLVDPASWVFGIGRRVCPGRYLAKSSLFILISTILAMFDILPPENEILRVEFSKGIVSYPEPFKCRITPRSASKASRITWRAAQSTI